MEDVEKDWEDVVEGSVDAEERQGNFLEPLERMGQEEEEGQDHQNHLPPDHAPLEPLERPQGAPRRCGRLLGRAPGREGGQKRL